MGIYEQTKAIIDEKIKGYDESVGLVRVYHKPNYHSYLKPGEHYFINESTKLAAAIFFSGYEKHYGIANKLLKKVSECQCKEGELTGLWSYFYEESLDKMVAPDWNYADFNAIPMIAILKEHADKLEAETLACLGEACLNACKAIMKRDLTIIYTNPCIMDMYVTIMCGEMFDKPELSKYGRKKLDMMYRHVMADKTFDEYNCPGYSILIANVFAIMLRHISDEEVQKKVGELNDIVWEMLGEHFHAKTGELGGPNLRRYENLFTDRDKSIYEYAVGAELICGGKEDYDLMDLVYNLKCHEKFKPMFGEKPEKNSVRLITRGSNYPWFSQSSVDMNYMCVDYCLGSFSLTDGWNQHTAVIGYIGDKKEKCCLRLRMLHNKYDFCSAFFASVQEKGAVLSAVNFHTNRGDTHVDLDPVVNATIKATDFRVRWQLEANTEKVIEKIKVTETENGCVLDVLGTRVEISYPFAEMSGEKPHFEITREGKELFADMVLYSGAEKKINLAKLDCAAVVTYITLGNNRAENVEVKKDDEYINVSGSLCGKKAELKALFAPAEQIPSVMATEIRLGGERIEHIGEMRC